jgi:hypothetical protein
MAPGLASAPRIQDGGSLSAANVEPAHQLEDVPETVELQLRNAYRKLGVRSRAELPNSLDAA